MDEGVAAPGGPCAPGDRSPGRWPPNDLRRDPKRPEGLIVTPLSAADAPEAVPLSAEAGWNQTVDDWRAMISLGEASGVRDAGGALVASALILLFDGPFAWISMVLVTAAYRRRGIATALMTRCMARLETLGLIPVLDATDAGRRVYGPLGFQPVHGLRRVRAERALAATPRGDITVRPIQECDWTAVAELDRRAFGAGRVALLRHLGMRQPARAMVAVDSGGVAGFVLVRDGRQALHVGPVVAGDPATAIALTAASLASASGPVYVDAVGGHRAYAEWLASVGFVVQRGFTRMILNRRAAFGDPRLLYAAAGPELG